MSLRTKLTIGLGFLFLIIFALAFYGSYDIQKLSEDADRILRDNYDSLVYCKNMLIALDDMRTAASSKILIPNPRSSSDYYANFFQASRSTFEKNLDAEKNNITEIHEREDVAELNDYYTLFLNLCVRMNRLDANPSLYFNDFISTYSNARQRIISINDINMQAIERKNLSAMHNASSMIISMAAAGAICIILAFFYFWYFPFYISNTMSYLSNRMKELLKNLGITLDTHTRDEAFVLLQAISLLENKLTKARKPKG
jgi:hypothetical protein